MVHKTIVIPYFVPHPEDPLVAQLQRLRAMKEEYLELRPLLEALSREGPLSDRLSKVASLTPTLPDSLDSSRTQMLCNGSYPKFSEIQSRCRL